MPQTAETRQKPRRRPSRHAAAEAAETANPLANHMVPLGERDLLRPTAVYGPCPPDIGLLLWGRNVRVGPTGHGRSFLRASSSGREETAYCAEDGLRIAPTPAVVRVREKWPSPLPISKPRSSAIWLAAFYRIRLLPVARRSRATGGRLRRRSTACSFHAWLPTSARRVTRQQVCCRLRADFGPNRSAVLLGERDLLGPEPVARSSALALRTMHCSNGGRASTWARRPAAVPSREPF